LELVLDRVLGKAGNDVIEVSVLQVQLIDTLAEHFTVGLMYYHGQNPPYRLDASSIALKKTKNERLAGHREASLNFNLTSCFF
jgi:hypothetical protein